MALRKHRLTIGVAAQATTTTPAHTRPGAPKGAAYDPSSAPYRKAVKKCAPILSKAGLTFTDGKDVPPLPARPGRPGRPEKGLRTSTGTDEGPSLTTSQA
ncbi:hypothetical protein ACFXDH_40625 [Streptomyces sp. NPDC059467]|uniref:hypothetical protein n=1 Tax=Streptomyces sp. NPDC059467 TaxID=3346844 RepID=UPI0036A762EF